MSSNQRVPRPRHHHATHLIIALATIALATIALGAVLLGSTAHAGDLRINEAMTSNGATLRDEDGASSDWIELYNSGDAPIDIDGYGLSDNADPLAWTFPPVSIAPSGYVLVFASGKDRSAPQWETVIDRGDTWSYLIPDSEPDAAWREPGFDTTGWSAGASGIGYGDGDDATLVPAGTISVFARATFVVEDPADVTQAILHIDFDDGFVAFINGQEIARESLSGTPPAFSETVAAFTEPRLVSGLRPFRYSIADITGMLRPGENVLAVQVHNTGSGSSDLTLIPVLTLGGSFALDEPRGVGELARPDLPLPHTNFKLNSNGETIRLSSPAGEVLDTLETGVLPSDVSAGRTPDGSETIAFFAEATPGSSNETESFSSIAGTPTFSHAGGFYPSAIALTIGTGTPGEAIHFTTDGADPTLASPLYDGAITIDTTTVVRARVIAPGALPNSAVTASYFIDDASTLPVVSIATTPANFFSVETGIYVFGDTYEQNFPHFGANFWENWERPVHVELIEPDGTTAISADSGTRIFGGWSRGHAQRSLAFFARREYGPSSFRYRIFPQKKINRFESFVLRNSGNDWQNTHFRDAMQTSLLEDLPVDRQAYRPARVYINGEYWGLMNLREKVNEHFLASNHADVDEDALDLLERDGRAIHGDDTHYRALVDLIATSDVSDPDVYADIQSRVDIENFVDYQAAQIYYDNTDWPGNNIKFWRPRTPTGRWRWIIYDTDFGFGIWNAGNYVNNTLSFALEANGPNWPNPPWSTLLLRRLTTNSEFVRLFVNRFATHMDTNFEAERVVDRIDAMAQTIQPEIPRQRQRYGSTVSAWNSQVAAMRNFARRREANVRQHLRSTFGLGSNTALTLTITPPGSGVIAVHEREVTENPWTGSYFDGLPVTVEARPHPGYQFVTWEGALAGAPPGTTIVPTTGGVEASAQFELDCDASGYVVIHEINYNAPEVDGNGADPGDWVEIHKPDLPRDRPPKAGHWSTFPMITSSPSRRRHDYPHAATSFCVRTQCSSARGFRKWRITSATSASRSAAAETRSNFATRRAR